MAARNVLLLVASVALAMVSVGVAAPAAAGMAALSATPTVTGVAPNSGPAAGGTSVTVTGTGFTGAGAVRFGPNAATNLVVNSDTQLTVTTPAGFGTADVTVNTPSGTSAVTPADQFTYGDTYTTLSTRQFRLAGNDGTTWQDVDPGGGLSLTVAPPPNAHALISANVDLWTDTAGYNQDIGIYLAESDPATYPGHIVAWKESGGYAGTFSPNAAFVQTLIPLGGATYHFKLQWKANRAAPPNAGIWAGAGPWPATSATFSPTRLTVRLLAGRPAVSTRQLRLSGNNGTDWQDMDLTNLSFTATPLANSLAIISANADLWTDTAGYNQDLAITVANMSTTQHTDQVVAWKESGGFAGTFSPNAAFVQAVVPMTAGNDYRIKLQWKTNRAAPPSASIFAGAGPWPANSVHYSPTMLTVILLPASGPLSTAVTTKQPLLSGNDGTTWSDIDPALSFTVTPPSNCMAVLTGNADLWTDTAGYNQDLGIYIAEADPTAYPGGIVGWKESGGFAGTFSPNAAFVEAVFPMTGGAYHIKLKWKDNRAAPANATIVAGAGPWPSGGAAYSPTRLTVGLTCA